MHGPMEFSRVGAVLEVEGLNAVGALVVPVGPDSPKDFDGGSAVAVRGVMVVDHAQQLGGQPLGQLTESHQVHFEIAASQSQDVHQLLPDPGADIHSVEMTAQQVLGNPGGQQEGPAAAALHLQRHLPDSTDEIGQQGAVLPGLTGRENRAHAGKIQLDSVELVDRRDLLHFAKDIVTHTLDGIVPNPVGIPGHDHDPVGILLLERDAILIVHVIDEGPPPRNELRVVVAAVHAFGEEDFQPSLTGLVLKNPYNVYPFPDPALVSGLIVGRQDLAGVGSHVALPPVPPHAVDAGLRVVDDGEATLQDGIDTWIGVRIDQQHVKVLGHPPAAVDGFQVNRRKPNGRLPSTRAILHGNPARTQLRGPDNTGNSSTQEFSTIHGVTTPPPCGNPFSELKGPISLSQRQAANENEAVPVADFPSQSCCCTLPAIGRIIPGRWAPARPIQCPELNLLSPSIHLRFLVRGLTHESTARTIRRGTD